MGKGGAHLQIEKMRRESINIGEKLEKASN